MYQCPEADPRQERVTRDPDDPLRRLPDASFLGDRGWVWCHQTDDDQQRGWEHQGDGNRLPPFEHSPGAKIGGPIVSRHEPSEPDYRSHREGAPIAVFAQYPDRTVTHRSAGDAKMDTGEEERSQDQ